MLRWFALLAVGMAAAATAAGPPPSDRPYVMATTTRPVGEVVICAKGVFDDLGKGDNTAADYGRRIDYRYSNLIGRSVSEPTMTLEVHDDGTLILYGFKTWRGAAGRMWKRLSETCFAELAGAEVVRPS